jgi:hypothetical protein
MRFRLTHSFHLAALASLGLLTTACTHDGGSATTSLEQSVAAPQASSGPRSQMMALASPHVSHQRPVAMLPAEAGPVRSVRAHDYVDGFRQDVALDGGSVSHIQNGITVLTRTTREPTLDDKVPLYRPTEAGIRSEIGAQFPHLSMQVAERSSSNLYGSYGLALGRAGGDVRCLYMWQWIDENRLPPNAGVVGPVSVRVRLCRAGTTFDALAALVDHLTIGNDAGGDRVADAAEIVGAPAETAAAVPVKHATRVKLARVRSHHKAVAHRDDGMRPQEASMPDGPRYMAASSGQAAIAAPAPASFAADLPPQALLGPKAGASKSY